MDKITFNNRAAPALSARILEQLQNNIDNGKVETEIYAINNIDANNCLKSGFYFLGSGCNHTPNNESNVRLIVNGGTTSPDVSQIGVTMNDGKVYSRYKTNNTWRDWKQLINEDTGFIYRGEMLSMNLCKQTGLYLYGATALVMVLANEEGTKVTQVLFDLLINNKISVRSYDSNYSSLWTEWKTIYAGGGGEGAACFTGNTKVLTPNGLVNISDIDVDVEVISFNESLNKLEIKEVDKIVSHTSEKLYLIDIGTEIIKTTWSHPFFVKDKGEVLASSLDIGDLLKCSDDSYVSIKSITITGDKEKVYEIRVKDNNNYFVGDTSVLVYNEKSVINDEA